MLARIKQLFWKNSWTIREQIIDDPVSELVFRFRKAPDGSMRFGIYGNLPFGNREFIFDRTGKEAGAGTQVAGTCPNPAKPHIVRT
jgi:hypothetical protein